MKLSEKIELNTSQPWLRREVAKLEQTNAALLRALLTIEDYVNNNWTDEEYHNADGTGWVTVVNEAIATAKEK